MIVDPLPAELHLAALALWETAGLTRPWNDAAADLDRALRSPAATVLAEISDGRLQATAMVGHDGHRGWVYYLAVDPALRDQGLGRSMMTACEQWVQARRIPKLQLMVRTTNTGVLSFYAHLGYLDADVVVLGRRLDV